MRRKIKSIISSVFLLSMIAYGQAVVINDPSEWVTLRNKKITLNTLIDTSDIESKNVVFNLFKNGIKQISSRNVNVESYSQQIEFGALEDDIIGGSDYLSVKWVIPGTEKKGTVEPLGIVSKESINDNEVNAGKTEENINKENITRLLSEGSKLLLKDQDIKVGWNKNSCQFLVKRENEIKNIIICIDPKNGKNAFVSYSDRFISLINSSDSLKAYFFKRVVKDNKIDYNENEWYQEIEYNYTENEIALIVPWFDLGIKIDKGRRFGIAVFIKDKNGSVITSYPEGAEEMIPGTWGNIKLN